MDEPIYKIMASEVLRVLWEASEERVKSLDWHILLYLYALFTYVHYRGFGIVCTLITSVFASVLLFVAGYHGLVVISAIIVATELRLWEMRHRQILDSLEVLRFRKKVTDTCGPSGFPK